MSKIRLNIFLGLIFISYYYDLYSQIQDKDDIQTQEVTVVKSNQPIISNVFKIRSAPMIGDTLFQQKFKIEYDHISAPVVSTFVPNKASPLKLKKQESSFLYNSYFSWGYGNQSQALIDFASMISIDRNQSMGVDFNFTSLGSQNNTLLKSQQNYFTTSFLHLFKSTKYRVESSFKFDRRHLNFYGLFTDYDWVNIPSFRSSLIDAEQNLNYLKIKSNWEWFNSIVKKIDFDTMLTIDYFDNTEQLINLNSEIRLPVFDFFLELKPNLNYINTNFVSSFIDNAPLNKQTSLLNLDFQIVNIGEKANFEFGTKAFYLFGDSIEKSNLYFFPKIKFSYRASSSNLSSFIEFDGDLKLNSYTLFSKTNPYVFPSLNLRPTNTPYSARAGVKNSLSSGLEFSFAGIYSRSEIHPIFKRLPYLISNFDLAYNMGTSYEIVYDRLDQLGFETSFLMRFNEYNKLSINTKYVNPISFNEISAWNVPSLTIDFEAHFRFFNKIYLQTYGNYIGRRDSAYHPVFLNTDFFESKPEIKSLDAFLYFSSRLIYQTKSNWAFFFEFKNNFGSNYSRWAFYQDYENNFLLGLRYKFDIVL
ncbi:MAG: hypothetical protein CMC57_00930 [Flavobacteriaceae bacterium]|nr:hypothetical protein [Flavobacteriaceae bacterium]|tara:strand:+ start:409 stop:2169 length:1761 start_codon:yes stop_codon:yes gene_type:complete